MVDQNGGIEVGSALPGCRRASARRFTTRTKISIRKGLKETRNKHYAQDLAAKTNETTSRRQVMVQRGENGLHEFYGRFLRGCFLGSLHRNHHAH